MKKFLSILVVSLILGFPMYAFANEGPLPLNSNAPADAQMHNQEGMKHYGAGHFDIALGHFQSAAKTSREFGEVHFNEAICLDKLGKHGEATMHFKAAKETAHGNTKILDSNILNAHLGH